MKTERHFAYLAYKDDIDVVYQGMIICELVGDVIQLFFGAVAAIRFTYREVCGLVCFSALFRVLLFVCIYIIYLSNLVVGPYLLAFEVPIMLLFAMGIVDLMHAKQIQSLYLYQTIVGSNVNLHFSALELSGGLFDVFLGFFAHQYLLNGGYAAATVIYLGGNATLFFLIYQFVRETQRNSRTNMEFAVSGAYYIDDRLHKLCDELQTIVYYNGIIMRRIFARGIATHILAVVSLVCFILSYSAPTKALFIAYQTIYKLFELAFVAGLLLGFQNKDEQTCLRYYYFQQEQINIKSDHSAEIHSNPLVGVYR